VLAVLHAVLINNSAFGVVKLDNMGDEATVEELRAALKDKEAQYERLRNQVCLRSGAVGLLRLKS
jgi:hypothetical protein